MHPALQAILRLPSKAELERNRAGGVNPLKIMATIKPLPAAFFLCAWFAWIVDACDIFALSLSIARLSTYFGFGNSNHQVMFASTVSTLLRPIGALVFGGLSDRYGRKWPFIFNLLCISLLSLATSFCRTFAEFMAVRALFGIGVGGMWGLAATTGLENLDGPARALLSGILQEGFSLGYIISAVVNIIASTHLAGPDGWRALFIFGACASALAAFFRLLLPESPYFVQRRAKIASSSWSSAKLRRTCAEVKLVLSKYWGRTLYGTCMMILLVMLARATSEMYPLLLSLTKGLSQTKTSQLIIIGSVGAILGGIIGGFASHHIGHRYTIIASKLLAGVLIPAWLLPHSFSGLAAGVFFLQMAAHGGTGVIPGLLSNLSPPQYRATMSGLMLQLGIMISSFSGPTMTAIGDRMQIPNPNFKPGNGSLKTVPDYTATSGIFTGIVIGCLVLFTLLGPDFTNPPEQVSEMESQPVAENDSDEPQLSPQATDEDADIETDDKELPKDDIAEK
ncbi:hypothetical protein OC834_003268 [Tilletia horrida]|nr:hypothetical protein OC834_003268 [Tilletia horrida]